MKTSILGVIRHILTTLGGGLVAKGWVDETSLFEAVGAVLTLLGVGWSIWDKRRAAKATPAAPAVLALGAAVLALGAAGCASIAPGNDPVVVQAERTTQVALEAFDAFLLWEYEQREVLSVVPEIRRVADKIRAQGPQWLSTARQMTKAYKHNRTPENKANLDTALTVLRAAIREAEGYLGKPVPPAPPGA